MKTFSIFKNNKKEEGSKHPDYNISISGAEGQPMVNIGGCWLRDSKSGIKYFSCKLNDAYVDNVKGFTRKGFAIVEDEKQSLPATVNHIEENPHNIPL